MTDVADARVGTLPDNVRANLVALLNSWRDEMPEIAEPAGDVQLIGISIDGKVVGGYLLHSAPASCEMVGLAIHPDHRKKGYGRMCCMDALFRAGKRPLVLTANDQSVDFAKAVGFKIFGKRKQSDGSTLTRFGWHAPRPTSDPNNPLAC
jgi:GNAT superfamily N-acetyltransferase